MRVVNIAFKWVLETLSLLRVQQFFERRFCIFRLYFCTTISHSADSAEPLLVRTGVTAVWSTRRFRTTDPGPQPLVSVHPPGGRCMPFGCLHPVCAAILATDKHATRHAPVSSVRPLCYVFFLFLFLDISNRPRIRSARLCELGSHFSHV